MLCWIMRSVYIKRFIGLVTCIFIALLYVRHLNSNRATIDTHRLKEGQSVENLTLPLSTVMPERYEEIGAPTTTLSEEINTVVHQMEQCLLQTNLSEFFEKRELYPEARESLVHILKVLRKLIPRFSMPYDMPCWKLPIAVHKSVVSHAGGRKDNVLSGTIENLTFSYTMDHRWSHVDLVNKVQWNRNKNIERNTVCLPKVFLLGYPKCGSTFLYCILQRVISASGCSSCSSGCEATKEARWWIANFLRNRLHRTSPEYLILYLLNFDKSAVYVERSQPAVTIDASPNLMFETMTFSRNKTIENYCLLPSLLPVILPDSKYFVVMRNPITMLYSAFWFSCTMLGQKLDFDVSKGPDLFHKMISMKIAIFNECKRQGKPLDFCVNLLVPPLNSADLPKCGRIRLEIGLYYFHARKWLSVVPHERIHFFTMEELATQDLQHTAKVILDFLELPSTNIKLPPKVQCNENTQHKIDYKHDSRLKMREDTKQILEEFFQPYNQMLADLLGDDKFLWNSMK